jgi:hypothetical protein
MSSNVSYRDSQPGPPSTSVGPLSPAGVNGFPPIVDTKMALKVEEQAKHIEEQEAMIKTLNKQVSELESSLGDAEKNRKCKSSYSHRLILIIPLPQFSNHGCRPLSWHGSAIR